jgi:hypothetical protein
VIGPGYINADLSHYFKHPGNSQDKMDTQTGVLGVLVGLAKDGIPIKTENKFQFDSAQLFYLIGALVLSAFVTGFSIAAGQKIFK